MIPKAYQGKYLLLKEGGFASIKAVYDYSDYFEATSSNYIIHSKDSSYTMPIVLKDTDADEGHSYNGKAILYYEDVNNPVTVFRFLTNQYLQRQLFRGWISGSGPGDAYIHIDDINK